MSDSGNKKVKPLLTIAITIVCYALQHIIPYISEPSHGLAIGEAMLFSALTAVVFALLITSESVCLGIAGALFAFKIMPPAISPLSSLNDTAGIAYYLVSRVAMIMFLAAIVRLYYSQPEPRKIKPLPIVLLIVTIPFFNNVSATLCDFAAAHSDGNMIPSYLIGFACYTATMLIFLFTATRVNRETASLVINYSLLSLSMRVASKLSAIVLFASRHSHISKSLYCWVAIYVFFIFAFLVLYKRNKAGKTA